MKQILGIYLSVFLIITLKLQEVCLSQEISYEDYVSQGGLPLPESLRDCPENWIKDNNNNNNSGRIVGGTVAKDGDAPFIIALLRLGKFMCGGTIFNELYIITAAHCVFGQNAGDLSIRYNTLFRETGEVINVSSYITHPKYNSKTTDDDIALIKLVSNMTLGSQNAKKVTLPSAGSDPSGTVTVFGWGTTSFGGAISKELRVVSVPIVSRNICRLPYALFLATITNNMICAGDILGGKDSCQGDSGGPCTQDGTLVGIVSWGVSCAKPFIPGVYTRVANYIPFINENTKS